MTRPLIGPVPSTVPTEGQKAQIARRFGMFIHFGINTFNNVEWSDGTLPIASYNPDTIDADEWVRTAKLAGMQYVILITKHHDGFCLWQTETTDYSVRCASNTTDVVRAVSEACRKYDVKLGLYYSLWDRHEPTYQQCFEEGYIPYMFRQLEELLDGRYGEVVELWLDGSWDKACKDWHFEALYDLVKRLQPMCQIGINHTVGVYSEEVTGPEDRYQPQNYQLNDPLRMFPCDFRLWDPYMCREDDPKLYTWQGEQYYLPFEMTICSREGFSWFNSDVYADKPLMDAAEIAEHLKILNAVDNCMVVNMPPDIHGRLTPSDVENLMKAARLAGCIQ